MDLKTQLGIVMYHFRVLAILLIHVNKGAVCTGSYIISLS